MGSQFASRGSPLVLTGIGGIVFDLDDTLYAERTYVWSGYEAVGRWLKARMDCPADPATRLRELYASGDRSRVFDRLLAEWNCPEADRLIPLLVTEYRQHAPDIQLADDAIRALDRWRTRLKLGLLSDGPLVMQQRKVAALKFPTSLDPIVLTDAWGREFWKPHVRGFEFIQTLWELHPTECAYIADNPAKDFVAPRRLGWRSIQICRPGNVYADSEIAQGGEPDESITSLDELVLTDEPLGD